MLKRARLETLQINVVRKCNQTCRHCHVDAGPWRTEMMSESVAQRVGLRLILEHKGGASVADHTTHEVFGN